MHGDEYEEARRTLEKDENAEEYREPSDLHIEMFRTETGRGMIVPAVFASRHLARNDFQRIGFGPYAPP